MEGIESIGMPPVASYVQHISKLQAAQADRMQRAAEAASEGAQPADRSDEQMKQLARDFESVLLTKLFDQVQQSIGDMGLGEEDTASKQVHGTFWFYLARDVADKGGFGLWEDFYEQFKQMGAAAGSGGLLDEGL